ncbi:YjiH family protein [Maledivibacter halophilus]|uniref:Nucleoside recognition GATE domain-containing membrane protein YjiH n=1 Tax=Maledivibacter halophilus TaxID=36842 RepID=A0A1T5M8A7_9FIRM|nr:nucleoside recognition domain-containing protein [Maledivibacter halophilus]SKC84333.1 nucleoside recognition GATE domain-containing membrane protein YjiH [Maledivibacter halophilus]
MSMKDPKLNEKISFKDFSKFLIPSAIGVFLFLFPIFKDGAVNIPLGYMIDFVKTFLKPVGMQIIYGVVFVSAIITILHRIFKFKFIEENKFWENIFKVGIIGFFIRTIALFFTFSLVFRPEGRVFNMIINANTGELAMSLMFTIFVTFFITCYTIPLISDYGIMDFTGTIFRGFTYPLFTIPGRSTVDLVTSWIGGNSTGILITIRQYVGGYYNAREAAIISTMFSVVSLPFCLVIANTLGVGDLFIQFYGILAIVGIISTIIIVRIPPLSVFDNSTYKNQEYQTNEIAPEGINKYKWALKRSINKAKEGGNLIDIITNGTKMYVDLFLTLAPTILTIAITALVISEYTPIFTWISKPMGYYLNMLGVPEAFEAAPATIIGFADMFLPAIVASSIASVKTKFIIGILSLVQIIYLSEMGAVLIGSQIPINVKHLAILFIEKTLIALPLIVLFTNLLGIQ